MAVVLSSAEIQPALRLLHGLSPANVVRSLHVTQRPADEIIQAMHTAAAGGRQPLDGAKPLIGRWELIAGQTARSNDSSGGTLKLSDYPEDWRGDPERVLRSDCHLASGICGT